MVENIYLAARNRRKYGLMSNSRAILIALLLLPVTVLAQPLTSQRGSASYYADSFHGRLMSNGKPYHRDSMTCAHLRYPLGTWLHVRNLSNNKEVNVKVTDRGPYSRKFVIDLSRAAARELDIIYHGHCPVVITPFVPARIPFLYEPSPEKSEFNLGFSDDEDALQPFWPDSASTTLHADTTLLRRAKQAQQMLKPQAPTSRKSRRQRK